MVGQTENDLYTDDTHVKEKTRIAFLLTRGICDY